LPKLTIPFKFLVVGEQHAADSWAFHGGIRPVKRSNHSAILWDRREGESVAEASWGVVTLR